MNPNTKILLDHIIQKGTSQTEDGTRLTEDQFIKMVSNWERETEQEAEKRYKADPANDWRWTGFGKALETERYRETPEQAFARFYESPENNWGRRNSPLQKALEIVKNDNSESAEFAKSLQTEDPRLPRPTGRLLGGGVTYDQLLEMHKG